MTQEDKELLLIDLCARLPYMPKIRITYQQQGIKGTDEGNVSCDFIEKIVNDLRSGVITDMQIYLRPMTSITKEELNECIGFSRTINIPHVRNWFEFAITNPAFTDWLNAHHFDYRGLIEKGLALEAPKGMYE